MKYDKAKAFPYPVLRPQSDDYRDADFLTTAEFAVGKDTVKAKISYAISNYEIADEIESGSAEYIAIISCRDTYFRTVLSSKDRKVEAEFGIGELRGEVRVDPYVVVRKNIDSFTSPDINPEFGPGPFKFEAGDILAQDEPQVFYIDRDMFKPVTSVFELVKKDDLTDGHWTIGFEEDHVQIEVSPEMKATLDDARNSKTNRVILLNSIYFAAVMQAIQKIQIDGSAYEGRRWAEIIKRQAANHGCDIDHHDSYLVAERLMKYPLNLMEQYVFKGQE